MDLVKKQAGSVRKTKESCHEETRKLQIRKAQEKTLLDTNAPAECPTAGLPYPVSVPESPSEKPRVKVPEA